MVCRLIEGFEHSTVEADYLGGKWSSGNVTTISPTYGRYGNGLRMSTTTSLQRTFDNQATWIVGAAYRAEALGAASAVPIFTVLDGVTIQALLVLNPNGTLSVCRTTAATVLGTSTYALAPNVWYSVEWRVTVGNAAATVVRVNEVEVVNLPSVDTQNTANAYANVVRLGQNVTGHLAAVDDVYILDTTGGVNDAFLGDVRVEQGWPPAGPGRRPPGRPRPGRTTPASTRPRRTPTRTTWRAPPRGRPTRTPSAT